MKQDNNKQGEVLVVEDDLTSLQFLTEFLMNSGYTVRPVKDGELALKSIQAKLPDVILLDIRLPGISGFEVCRRLKADEKTCNIPVIFLSAVTETFDKVTAFGYGAVDYLTKPIVSEELLARVQTHITNNLLRQELRETNRNLEALVALRTEDLRKVNSDLLMEIAEHKRTEEELKQRNRELRAISYCNQTLMRAYDEQTLLNEICQIICDEAGYMLAWVGYAENDDARTVHPLAWAGVEDGYLSTANLTWADTEYGRGPTGTAIRRGECICIQDFATDIQASPWRESALQRGYRSSIALPLKDEMSKTFGVLNIYSMEPNAFTQDEMRLLEELSGDLAFGITVLRTRMKRREAEESLRESEQKYRTLFEESFDCIFITSPDGKILDINKKGIIMFGYNTKEEMLSLNLERDVYLFPQDRKRILSIVDSQGMAECEIIVKKKNGEKMFTYCSFTAVKNEDGVISLYSGILRDITERKRADEEREKLQIQLLQAQKMESVGRLAGGVAHDFNNMLGVIMGHTELALDNMAPSHPLFTPMMEIQKSARRSAELTRQLLAFARKQTIALKELNLNETVEGMLSMLRRLIGENINLSWVPGAGVWTVKADPSQIDQILDNLCVNARDAISSVGRITIETNSATFDDAYCSANLDVVPGDYVMLAVSDNGCGMEKDVLDKIFEPFFTTKEMGKGTGLGLATVYGIVKQNNGFINVYSEPGKGTTFKIYLPRYSASTEHRQKKCSMEPSVMGVETIMVVEDELPMLQIITMMLERHGYNMLTASTPDEAIRVAGEYTGELHLLITDVIMPDMDVRDMVKILNSLYPNLKCLFMSGYTANVIAHHGVLDEGIHFIQKPFSRQTLINKVRKILDDKASVLKSD